MQEKVITKLEEMLNKSAALLREREATVSILPSNRKNEQEIHHVIFSIEILEFPHTIFFL